MNIPTSLVIGSLLIAGNNASAWHTDFFKEFDEHFKRMDETFHEVSQRMNQWHDEISKADSKNKTPDAPKKRITITETEDGILLEYTADLGDNRDVNIDEENKEIIIRSNKKPCLTLRLLHNNKYLRAIEEQSSQQEQTTDKGKSFSSHSYQQSHTHGLSQAVELPELDQIDYSTGTLKIILPYKKTKSKSL